MYMYSMIGANFQATQCLVVIIKDSALVDESHWPMLGQLLLEVGPT